MQYSPDTFDECAHCDTEKPNRNSLLCEAHQIWNDFNHLFTCNNQPFLGCDRWGEDGFILSSKLKDLDYTPANNFRTTADCQICREVNRVCQEEGFNSRTGSIAVYRPFLASSSWSRWRELGIKQMDPSRVCCVLPILLKKTPRRKRLRNDNYIPAYLELSLAYDKTGTGLQLVTRWNRSYFDLNFIQSWLAVCDVSHSTECRTTIVPTALPSNCRFVDTFNRCVVSEPPEMDGYVALSYLWSSATGGTNIELTSANQQQLHQTGSLTPELLPTVINDAIVLCWGLGIKHIWVDRLCIIQDDASSKHSQILAMDAIFALAELTITALTDGHSAVGLPGSPNRSRALRKMTSQHEWSFWEFCDHDHENVRAVMHTRSLVESSPWSTRGWTFQEGMLSRRQLVISSHQTILRCGEVTLNSNAPHEVSELSLDVGGSDPAQELDVRDVQSYTAYRRVVEHYSTKILSFGSDILNAFAGITKVVEKVLATRITYGHTEGYFLESLMWTPFPTSSKRRANIQIPSWSWAGQESDVKYHCEEEDSSDFVIGSAGDLVGFHVVDDEIESGFRNIETIPRWFDKPDMRPFDVPMETQNCSRSQVLAENWEAIMTSLLLRHKRTSYFDNVVATWKNCPHNPSEAAKRDSIPQSILGPIRATRLVGALVFNTTRAYVKLRVLYCDALEVWIYNRQDHPIGLIWDMPREWIAREGSLSHSLREVVVLGAGLSNAGDGRWWPSRNDRYYEKFCLFVMLLEKTRETIPVCYRRVAVGIVQTSLWASAEPDWATVIVE